MNNSFLRSGELGNIGLKQLIEARQMTTTKWDQTGMLDGLKGAMRENVAQLYENQANHLLYESTVADQSGSFETIAFPVIRRTYAKLLANELVSVQALQMPVGRLYFINPRISKRTADADGNMGHRSMQGAFANGAAEFTLDAEGRKVYNADGNLSMVAGGDRYNNNVMYDQFYATEYGSYGDSLFNSTSGKILAKSSVVSLNSTAVDGTAKSIMTKITGFSVDGRGKLKGPIGVPSDTEEFLSSLKITANQDLLFPGTTTVAVKAGKEIAFRIMPQAYGRAIVDETGAIRIELLLTASDNDGNYVALTATDATTIAFSATYAVYTDLEGDSEIAEVSFDFDYVTVDVGQPKKLRATYTPEAQQDVQAFQSVDVEAELINMLSETISAEIDREILRDIRAGAAWISKWDAKGYDKKIMNGGVIGITRKDYNQELITEINKISARINKSTLRGGANWIVVSPEISAIFNDLEYFHATNASPEETKYSLGIEKSGSLQNRMQVFVDVYSPANTVLIGHKGDGIFHAGYIYAPYVPLMLFPKVMNPNDFRTVLGIMTRYAKKMVNNRFFGKILVDGLDWMNPNDFLLA
jgi:hypothetical protein